MRILYSAKDPVRNYQNLLQIPQFQTHVPLAILAHYCVFLTQATLLRLRCLALYQQKNVLFS